MNFSHHEFSGGEMERAPELLRPTEKAENLGEDRRARTEEIFKRAFLPHDQSTKECEPLSIQDKEERRELPTGELPRTPGPIISSPERGGKEDAPFHPDDVFRRALLKPEISEERVAAEDLQFDGISMKDSKLPASQIPVLHAKEQSTEDENRKADVNSKTANDAQDEEKLYSTYDERISQTPKEGERGTWTGERGESKYIPFDERLKEILSQYGIDGIEYQNGIPDFSPCAEATVEIDNMSSKRYGPGGNFEQCDQKCAEQWNKEGRDGKTDWTARDVADWRAQNGYTWHERNDRKTCDLVPTEINDKFGHLGGVGECNRQSQTTEQKGVFDE